MQYRLIDIYYEGKGNVALIERKTNTRYPEYAVVRDLDRSISMERDDQWSRTIGYWNNDMRGLASAVDCFRNLTEDNYITRARLEELATLFKDGLVEDDEEQAIEYFNETCEMTEYEKDFFGIDIVEVTED